MFGFLQQFLLKRKLAKRKRKVQVHNLGSAKSALVIYSYNGPNREKELREFCRFLKEEGIKTSSLAFLPKKLKKEEEGPKEELDYYYFDKKETSWLNIPQSTRLKKIIQNDYDLLIDLNLEESFPIEWVSYISKASFKVGRSSGYQKESCDLLLSPKEKNILALQEQCKIYLNMINRKNANN